MFLALFGLSLTSCSNDDDDNNVSNISIKLDEIGEKNAKEAVAGTDLHIAATILADAQIKTLKVEIKNAEGKTIVAKDYSSGDKYKGLKKAMFHEHLDIPENTVAGLYTFVMTVTDTKNKTVNAQEKLTIKAIDPNAPKITELIIGDGQRKAKPGQKLLVKATVETKAAVKKIEIELHGSKEYPFDIKGYEGKTGKFSVETEITVPAEAAAGTYHVHFSVEDSRDRETTVEIKDFSIQR